MGSSHSCDPVRYAVQFPIQAWDFEDVVDVDCGAPSGVFDVLASFGAEQIIRTTATFFIAAFCVISPSLRLLAFANKVGRLISFPEPRESFEHGRSYTPSAEATVRSNTSQNWCPDIMQYHSMTYGRKIALVRLIFVNCEAVCSPECAEGLPAPGQTAPSMGVPVGNPIRAYWWCSSPRIGVDRIAPTHCAVRGRGASLLNARCVLAPL